MNLLIFLFFISFTVISADFTENDASNENEITLYPNETKACRMYNDLCYFALILPNSMYNLTAEIQHPKTAKVNQIIQCDNLNETIANPEYIFECHKINNTDLSREVYLIHVKPNLIGYTSLTISANMENRKITATQNLIVKEPKRFIDRIFTIFVWSVQILVSFLMGVLIDIESLKKLIKIPIPVGIGFTCQYLLMPLLAFGISILFSFRPAESLALFIYGCSPGGNQSNNWTIIFDADIDLSVIMTFCSTVASLVMMPAWIYSLGSFFSSKANITIPIFGLFTNLLITIVPCLTGLIASIAAPNIKKIAMRISKPFVIIVIISFFTVLFSAKFFIFSLITWKNALSTLIPWSGFLLGGFIASLFKFPRSQVLAISFETGYQNIGVAMLIIIHNFPSPDSDLVILPLMCIGLLTPLPFYFALLVRSIRKFYKNWKKPNTKENLEREKDFEASNEMIEKN